MTESGEAAGGKVSVKPEIPPNHSPAMTTAPLRVPGLDIARGIALVAMIIYHFAWDLSFLGLIDADIQEIPGWILFARSIAASFLVLVGIGLVLGHAAGWNRAAFLRRLGLIAGAAMLVSAGTYLVMPDNFVFFGILHAIAVASVLALPFLRLPALLTGLIAAGAFALPSLLKLEAFSAPWLVWLGLGTRTTFANDFVPVFPWLGCVLAGIALAKTINFTRFTAPAPKALPARLLMAAGRNSLLVYLVHQPLLYGVLSLAAMAGAPKVDREAQVFMSSCQSQCRAAGGEATLCTRICTCAVGALKAEGLWVAVLADKLDVPMSVRTEGISRRCAEAARSASPRP